MCWGGDREHVEVLNKALRAEREAESEGVGCYCSFTSVSLFPPSLHYSGDAGRQGHW